MTKLSVVLISRNQAWNIARLIESVQESTAWFEACEIILVDSASTDGTPEIACGYDVSVIRLDEGQRLTAAAGRFVGTKHSTHDLILFLDGDMQLCEAGLRRMIEVIREDPTAGAVCGEIVDRPLPESSEFRCDPMFRESSCRVRQIQRTRGAALFHRSVLNDAGGGFNPYLYSDEEPELSIRIREAGFGILAVNDVLALHYTEPAEEISTLVGRWRRRLFLGSGQILRRHVGTPLFWRYVRERGFVFLPAAVIALGLAAAVAPFWGGSWWWLVGWLVVLALGFWRLAARKGGAHQAARTVLRRLFILDGTIRGFFHAAPDPRHFEPRLRVMKRVGEDSNEAREASENLERAPSNV